MSWQYTRYLISICLKVSGHCRNAQLAISLWHVVSEKVKYIYTYHKPPLGQKANKLLQKCKPHLRKTPVQDEYIATVVALLAAFEFLLQYQ